MQIFGIRQCLQKLSCQRFVPGTGIVYVGSCKGERPKTIKTSLSLGNDSRGSPFKKRLSCL